MRIRGENGEVFEICDNDVTDQHHVPGQSYYRLKPKSKVFVNGKQIKPKRDTKFSLTDDCDLQLFVDVDDEEKE